MSIMEVDRFKVGPCRVSEMQQLRTLLNKVFMEERNATGDLFTFAPLLYTEENIENLRVVRERKRIVGHAGILPRSIRWRGQVFEVGLVGGVCARRDLRGLGVGTLVMEDVAQRMEELELDFGVLWTGSPGFYQRLRWRLAGGVVLMGIQEAMGQSSTRHEIMRIEETPFGPEDCYRLHVKAARHEVVRTPEETRTLMTAEHVDTLIGLEGGRLAGYATSTGRVIQEIEGHAEVCMSLIDRGASMGVRRCVFPLNDPRIAAIEGTLPVHVDRRPLGMVLIINRTTLVEKIVEETGISAEELGIGLTASDEMVMMGIFGGPERQPEDEPLPLDIHVSYLDHV